MFFMLLNLLCMCFIQKFFIHVCQEYWSVLFFFFPCLVLVARWYWAYRTSPEEFPWFQLDGIFEISWSFFKLWYSSAVMPSALGFSLLGNFITPSISWLVIGLLWFLTIFQFNFTKYEVGNVTFLPYFLICCDIITLMILWISEALIITFPF